MRYLSLCQRYTLLLAILLLGVRPGAAQTSRRYTDRVISFLNTANPNLATGHDPGTQATLTPPALFGAAALRLSFAGPNPAGSQAGLVVNSGGLLTLAALNGLAINTYLAPSTVPQETIQLSQLLTLQVLNAGSATAAFTTTKPFDQLELAAGGLLNAYSFGLVEVFADVAAPLPVELVDFRGLATQAGVQLSWQTASELNNSYFAIERANDQEAAFAELGRVAGAGTSSQAHRYQFVDAAPSPLNYYRLRQVDADGAAHYSPVVAVRAVPSTRLLAYPNPATSTLLVASPAQVHLSLLDQQGRLVRQTMLAAGQQPLDISGLPPGIYYLRDAATGQSTRFVKIGQ
ncbi:MAG: T9SS type A sorting domain-containing protein [Hymenobacter sp.]|nr:MAG: T9SS type A sorting domain-containing protein [Hymenobacter sp.]